jgi:hypothetical protein
MTRLTEKNHVVLTTSQPNLGIEAGAKGRIVLVYDTTPPGIYEVEFILDQADHALRVTCSGEELKPL